MKLFDDIKNALGNWSKRGEYSEAFGRGDALGYLRNPRKTILGAGMTESKALATAAVFCCVRVIADGIAGMSLELVQDMPNGSTRKAKEYDEYWLFMDRPNEEDTTKEFLESYLTSIILQGDAFAHSWRNNKNRVTELRYMDPDTVSVSRQGAAGRLVYRASDPYDGRALTLFQGDGIVHSKRFRRDTVDGRGLSVLSHHRETFGLSLTQSEYSGRLYSDGIIPRGYLKTEMPELDDAQIRKMRKKLKSSYAGMSNLGEMPILPLGLDFKSMAIPVQDAAMIDNFGYTERQIAQIFGVPLWALHNYDGIKFATTEEQQIDLVTNCLRPWIEMLETSFTANILTTPMRKAGYRYQIDETTYYRGATKSLHETYAVDIQNGIKTQNEVRYELNLDPQPGGDELLLPMNSMSQKDKELEREAKKKALEAPQPDPNAPEAQGQLKPGTPEEQKQQDGNGGDKPAQKGQSNNPAGAVKKRSAAEEALLQNVRDAHERCASKVQKVREKYPDDASMVEKTLGDHAAYRQNVMASSVRNAFIGMRPADTAAPLEATLFIESIDGSEDTADQFIKTLVTAIDGVTE